MDERLAELAAEYGLDGRSVEPLRKLLALLAADETAPTTVRAPAQAVDVHVADSLTGLSLPEVREARRIADLGAGAGFPGLVLAATLPEARVALVESVGRKCAFLERAVETAGVTNADVVCARAEEWRDGLGACDLVTARALAPLAVIAEYAAPLLVLGGSLVAWKGARSDKEEADAATAADELGLELRRIAPVSPFQAAEHRTLYLYSKVTETPSKYPRRAGMARKRPVGGST